MPRLRFADPLGQMASLAAKGAALELEECRQLIWLAENIFTRLMIESGHDQRQVRRLTTKFRDAGRRSPPWRPVSSRVPGRPQDGADGNRTLRWNLELDHKFYADELSATLVEVKYYLQALSMQGAPKLGVDEISSGFHWLLGHDVQPDRYVDPIQLIPINLHEVVENARLIQSGHLTPLDRGGRHEPGNAFLMLARSNQLQGNLTVDELLHLMGEIVSRHHGTLVERVA